MGYTTQDYVGGAWLIGSTGFENTGSGSINLNDLVKGFVTTSAKVDDFTVMRVANPYIQIQNRNPDGSIGAGYKEWFWCADAYLDEDGNETGPAWADTDGCAAGGFYNPDVKVDPGVAFWFKDPTETKMTLTLAGQVLASSDKEITPTMNVWNLICNPFPEPISLNYTSDQITWTGLTASKVDDFEVMRVNNPYIQVQNRDENGILTAGYKEWFWCTDAYLDEEGNQTGPAWADTDGCAAGGFYNPDVKIPVGAGFWFKDPSSEVTITFNK